MSIYDLMHKSVKCGTIILDDDVAKVLRYINDGNGLSPYLGAADLSKMKKWWEMRAVPASRLAIRDMIKKAGYLNSETYLAKNLALSMTDTYWIKPHGEDISYDDVKFTNFAAYHEGKVPYHNTTSFDPNASLGGQMEKYWDLGHNPPVLVKESYKYFGQQSLNEVFATKLHEMQNSQIPFVRYTASVTEDRGILSKCNAFTSEKIEFIPAYEIVSSVKIINDISKYDAYIQICADNGIPCEVIQQFMDYQTMTDFLISNTDEHLLNFGVLRDTETMKLIAPAPIFDSGNSMFYSENMKQPYSRSEILNRKITAMYEREEKMLAKVHDKYVVKMDLIPSPAEVKELYAESGIPEWKSDVISKNYETKALMLQEFQRGKIISFYHEKKIEKVRPKITQKFIMMCGIPGSGKTFAAKRILDALKKNGQQEADAKLVYPLDKIVHFSGLLTKSLSPDFPLDDLHGKVILISSNDIRNEIREKYPEKYTESLVFQIVDARMDAALADGATVVYDSMNIDRSVRKKYLEKAKNAGIEKNFYSTHFLTSPCGYGTTKISQQTTGGNA